MPEKDYKEIILQDEDYLNALLAEIKQAKASIDLQVYIFEDDEVGKKVADALCQAAKRGVTIRVLVDGVGSMTWGGKVTEQLEKHGIKTKVFHPLPWKISHWHRSNIKSDYIITKLIGLFSKINARNHRKACIIDQSILFIGSANITNHILTTKKDGPCWRETSMKITGANLEEVQYSFDKTWGRMPFRNRFKHTLQNLKRKKQRSIFYLNDSWRRRRKFHNILIDKIKQSKKRIWVTNAYFMPDSHLLKVLIKASRRGVDVRILLPHKSDVVVVTMAAAAFYSSLLRNGILTYEYTPTILHAKILIIDDWFVIGSSNLNNRSFKHDLEIDANLYDDDAKKIVEEQFLQDLKQSRQLKEKDLQQPLYKRILAKILLKISHWL